MQNAVERLHILLLSSWYPSRVSPFLGNFVQEQARLLAKNHSVTVLYIKTDSSVPEIENTEKVDNNLKEIIYYVPEKSNFLSRKKEFDRAFKAGISKLNAVDLIHAHCILPKGHLFVKAKKHFNCPLIVTEHGSYFRPERKNKWNFKERFVVSYSRKSIDGLIAVSDFLKSDLQKCFSEKLIEVIPNPINTALFRPGQQPDDSIKQFLHVSTLDPELKDPQGIIEAVDLLCEKGYSNFKLTIVSDEPYSKWQHVVNEKKLNQYIEFAGPMQHSDLVGYYQNSHAFVLFSRYETFSIVIAEAWSTGIPVISTPVGIASKMTDEQGLLVLNHDPLSLALEMEKILNGLSFHAQTIRDKASQFSSENVLKQLNQLYERFTKQG